MKESSVDISLWDNYSLLILFSIDTSVYEQLLPVINSSKRTSLQSMNKKDGICFKLFRKSGGLECS